MTSDRSEVEAARARAATALRRFGHALHSADADVAMLDAVARQAEAETDRLEHAPRRTRDLSRLRRGIWADAVAEGEEIDHFEDCFVSGDWNPLGVGLTMRREGDEVVAEVTLGPAFEGAPGRAHGGIVAAIFDDVLGGLLRLIQQPAFTGELRVRYLAPTPINVPLSFRARVERTEGRKIDTVATAYSHAEDTPVEIASGWARFISIPSYLPDGGDA